MHPAGHEALMDSEAEAASRPGELPSPVAAPRKGAVAITVVATALATLVLHLACGGRYGVFRDELYFIACGRHLAWGYVDQPPLIAILARIANDLFGESVLGLRLLPSVASAATVAMTGLLARRLGADVFGVALAGIAVLAAPVLMTLGHYLTMNAFELLLWVSVAYGTVRLVQTRSGRLWPVLGLLVGVGLLDKYSMAFLAVALVAGLLLGPERRVLRDWRFALALAIATLVVLPNLLWQVDHGLPMLELLRNGRLYKNVPFSVGGFFQAQLVYDGPLDLLVLGAGLVFLLGTRAGRPYRFLGLAFVGVLAIELAGRAKPYYLAPALPMLLAAGGAAWARWLEPRWARLGAAGVLAASALVLAPLALPLLPPPTYVAYQARLGLAPKPFERQTLGPLPQIFADQFGWRTLTRAVAQVYDGLPEPERAHAGIFVANYGEAAALEIYGKALGLPRPMSGHNNYFLWGPTPGHTDPLITVMRDPARLRKAYREVKRVGTVPDVPWAMPYERGLPIWVAHGLKAPIDQLWPGVKIFI